MGLDKENSVEFVYEISPDTPTPALSKPVHVEDEDEDDGDAKYNKKKLDEERVDEVEGPSKKKKDEKKKEEKPMVTQGQMFRYADTTDKWLMILGSLASAAVGTALPIMSLVFGDLIDIFLPENVLNPSYSVSANITKVALNFLYIGIASAVMSFFQHCFWTLSAERQAAIIRRKYLESVLRQEIAWYDTTRPSELSTRIATDTKLMQDGMGAKVSTAIMHLSTFVAGLAVGLANGWQLTLVILAVSPILGVVGAFVSKIMASFTVVQQNSYATAGGVAEETIGAIRTVATFSGEQKESSRFERLLSAGYKVGIKNGYINGSGFGAIMFIIFASYGLAFFVGATMIKNHTYNHSAGHDWTGGDVTTVFFAVLMGTMGMGQISPSTAAMSEGRAAAHKIFEVIDRQSKIDPKEERGIVLEKQNIRGEVVFKDIEFSYPSRSDVPIFRGFNLTCRAGETTALVGDSGGGKSTVIGLLERFYDPAAGQVFLDGIDIKEINIKSLRSCIGLVSQEPTLFAGTIAFNIAMGKPGCSRDEIIECAKTANAHGFISALPHGYDTVIGEKGTQISGGQKQRVAIARAIIKNPSILLLDEATSALDAESEALVQEALDRLMIGRTTIVIAHRLSTIRHAHSIAAIRKGVVLEQGTHDELLALDGLYSDLHSRSTPIKEKSKEEKEKELEEKKLKEEREIQEKAALAGSSNLKSSSAIVDEENPIEPEQETKEASLWRVIKYSYPERYYLFGGLIAAAVQGLVQPLYSIIFSEILGVFQGVDTGEMMKKSRFWALMFVVLGIGAGVTIFIQLAMFTYVGEKLTSRIRAAAYQAVLRQEIGFFDREENRVGTLTSNLASDATHVRSISTQLLGIVIANASGIIAGCIIALVAGWKLAIVVIACMPLVIGACAVQFKSLMGLSKGGKDAYGQAGQVATEAIGAIRTVASFSAEDQILDTYSSRLAGPTSAGKKRAFMSGGANAASQFTQYAINCLAFWYGGVLISQSYWPAKDYSACSSANFVTIPTDRCHYFLDVLNGFVNMIKVFMAIVIVAMNVGQSFSWLPDMAKAREGAKGLFRLVDRRSKIDPTDTSGSRPDIVGNIEFRNVYFAYPTRRNRQVFKDFNLVIPAGTTCALVGDSGGGKSTVIQMLERFYDPQQGQVLIDGNNTRSINIQYLRECMGLVSQEPTLFDATILQNIRYGKDDATLDEVEAAAKAANAHEFIVNLPQGYDTPLGDKFTQLSGGQKQRVAIARAILRNPKIMLLDEATSALDSQSEKLVQQALDNLMKGRTAVVIAHRLSTVKNADMIVVLKGGSVVEIGKHDELVERRGFYFNLIQRQL